MSRNEIDSRKDKNKSGKKSTNKINTNVTDTIENTIDNIKNIIKTKIRPVLVMDGGNIEFVDYKNKVVSVKLLGACNGCPLASITLKNTVKTMIRESIPEVEDVEAVDFDEGELE